MKKLGYAILIVFGALLAIFGFALFWGAFTHTSIIPNISSTQNIIIDYIVSFLEGLFGGILLFTGGIILIYIGYIGFKR
jgi:hypothetical protein